MNESQGYRWQRRERPSPAQRRVLDALLEGGTNADIATRIGISFETVKWHISELLAETGLLDRGSLARWWLSEVAEARQKEREATMDSQAIIPPITPGLNYRDAQAAMRWLGEVLGFLTAVLYEEDDGRVAFAQLVWRTGAIHVSTREEKGRLPQTGPSSIVLTADDAEAVDRLYERAVAAGAEVMLPIEDTFYGNHGFSLRDPEGNLWHVGTPWLESEAAKRLPQRRVP